LGCETGADFSVHFRRKNSNKKCEICYIYIEKCFLIVMLRKKRAFVVIEHKKYTPLLKNPGAITNP